MTLDYDHLKQRKYIDPCLVIVKAKLLHLTDYGQEFNRFFSLCSNLGNDVSFQEDHMFYLQGEQHLQLVPFKNIFPLHCRIFSW